MACVIVSQKMVSLFVSMRLCVISMCLFGWFVFYCVMLHGSLALSVCLLFLVYWVDGA